MSKISLHIIYTKTCGTRSQGIEDCEPRIFSRHSNSVRLTRISSGNQLQKGGVLFVGLDLRSRCGRDATNTSFRVLQKGGVPAAPSGTATLLRLSPSHLVRPRRRPPPTSGARGSHGLTGGVYKARERIHRAMADARLLANPASWGRVADPNPNYDAF